MILGSACIIAASSIGLVRLGLEDHHGLIVFHLAIFAAALIGAFFQDDLGRFLQWAAALLLAAACCACMWDSSGKLATVPAGWRNVYPPVAITAAMVYAHLTGCRAFVLAAGAGAIGWLSALGARTYADLRRIVTGLDWIVCGMAFFALAAVISLIKTGLPARWKRRHEESTPRAVANAERG
jgi:hypothetical protein